MSINQAVVFTKPVHHLGIDLSAEQLDRRARAFFEEKGFSFAVNRTVSGSELAARNIIRQHYQMYSEASCTSSADALGLSGSAKQKFEAAFGKNWDAEVAAGRIMGNPELLIKKGISAEHLFERWNECFASKATQKIQDGLLIARLESLDCYCINAFYPVMEANFNNPVNVMHYYVVEFSPEQTSWEQFRKTILGSTDASKAAQESFRGQLYAEFAVEYPGRDNFVHGSAGPLEGFIERTIHEDAVDMHSNPVGHYLAQKGMDLPGFKQWKAAQSIAQLGALFDATEEKNTDDIRGDLENIVS